MTSTERVKNYRERQALVGRLKREAYLTDEEWAEVKAFIQLLRKSKNK